MSNRQIKWWYRYYPKKDGTKKGTSLLENFTSVEVSKGVIIARDIEHKSSKTHSDPQSKDKTSNAKQFALFRSWAEFQAYSKRQTSRHFYEVILEKQPQKLRFDYDSNNPEEADKDFPLVMQAVHKTFQALYQIMLTSKNLIICSSHSEVKRSWHIIIHGYYVTTKEQAKLFYDHVWAQVSPTVNANLTRCLDDTVYKSTQLFRLLGSTKLNQQRVKILDPQSAPFTFEQTLVTHVINCKKLPEILTAPKREHPTKSHKKHTLQEIDDALARLSPERWQRYASWITIGQALKSELGDQGLPLWKKHSQANYAKYNEAHHDEKWNGFDKSGTTIGTVIYWASIDTPRPPPISQQQTDIAAWVHEWETDESDSDEQETDITAKDNIDTDSHFDSQSYSDQIQTSGPPERQKKHILSNIPLNAVPQHPKGKPAIYSEGRYFSDIPKLMGKPVTMDQVKGFLNETCVCILNGGNIHYYTKTLEDGNLVYTRVKPKEFTQIKLTIKQPPPPKVQVDVTEKKTLKKMLHEKPPKDHHMPLATILETHAHNIMYDRAVFRPYARYEDFERQNTQEKLFNLFTGFHAQLNNDPIDEKLIQPWLWHIKHILCSGNEEASEYMLNWLAHLCQRPHKKIGVMIALRSLMQGAGKNIFWDFVGKNILGSHLYVVLNDMDQLLSKFNSIVQSKLLTICDEIGNYGGSFRSNDKLKSVISQREQVSELKGVDARQSEDYQNFVGLSNNPWPYKVEAGDRRFFVLEVSNDKAGDVAYFDYLARHATDECGNHFYNMLMRRDISSWKAERMPMTELKRSFKLLSCPAPVSFMIDCLSKRQNHAFKWSDNGSAIVYSEELFEGFQAWQREENNVERFSKNSLSEGLKVIGLNAGRVKRPGCDQKRGFRLERNALLGNIRKFLKDPEFDVDYDSDTMPEPSATHDDIDLFTLSDAED